MNVAGLFLTSKWEWAGQATNALLARFPALKRSGRRKLADHQSTGGKAPSPQPSALAGSGKVANALLNPPSLPAVDLVGPSVDDDIRRAIQRYGADAVKAAVKEATKRKRGRRREPDWPELREVIESDAREWLAGGDPFAARSNYAIAKDFAERNPGHSMVSTHKRIERKLSKRPYDRRWLTLVTAENMSRDDYAYLAHLRALEALATHDAPMEDVWRSFLERANATIADYEAREGATPPESMTFSEVEEAVKNQGLAALISSRPARGLFGIPRPQTSLGASLRVAVAGDEK